MPRLDETLVDFLRQDTAKRFWVGLSGGLDSCVLLHALLQARPARPVNAIHVNHQLSPNAVDWESHCVSLAEEYKVSLHIERVDVSTAGRGLENAARDARYAAFEQVMGENDLLLLAHHRDDQAETLMLRLLRGAGLRGLAAMPPLRQLGRGHLARPLLKHSREELRAYADAHSLRWMEDESNSDSRFDRNFLRQQVFPFLAARWPHYSERFQVTAALLSESEELLREYAGEDLARADLRPERLGWSVSLVKLAELGRPRRNALLREWVRRAGFRLPDQAQLAHIDDLVAAPRDANPILAWADAELRRYGDRLFLLPRLPSPEPLNRAWSLPQPCHLADGSELRAGPSSVGLRADCDYHLSLRKGGERCRPHNRTHSQTLKKLLQEYGLEPWLRDRVPLIYCGDRLAAVGDLWICADFYVERAPAWQIQWHYDRR